MDKTITPKRYEDDVYGWALEQAAALRRRAANEVDWENVAEEIESLGRQQASELNSRFIVLCAHLLKWMYQPQRQSRSWAATIREQRRQIQRLMKVNPSLQSLENGEFLDAYETARLRASGETDVDVETFPASPPFTLDQAKDLDWMPATDGDDPGL